MTSFDSRTTLNREEAKAVYDKFALNAQSGGQDTDSGYGGPAVEAMLDMASFELASSVLEFGSGQGKLCELVLSSDREKKLHWRAIDQSPEMVKRFFDRCVTRFGKGRCSIELLREGNPSDVKVAPHSVDRFVSTYCLDLLSEDDIYRVLKLAEYSLDPKSGLILLAGITWGYRASFKTFMMTVVWELLYAFWRKKVGGCRPQNLAPYLKAQGWRIEKAVKTLPKGYPWMVSEVISARPPLKPSES